MGEEPTKPRKKRQRKTPLTREAVLSAAMRLADREGVDALSMRKLARALRVEAMSLYNHVANKDDLLDGLVDRVIGEIELPTLGGDWREAMRRRALSAHDVLMRHPWATLLILSRVNTGPAMLRYIDATLGCLREAGFSWALADYAWNTLDGHVYGFTLQRLTFPFEPKEYAAKAAEYAPMVPADTYPYMRGLTLEVAEGRHDGVQELELGLGLLLEGFERLRVEGWTR
ncbi:MAG: TetR/AcrR family transcriptional regulator C-terminal domain-containing protein [Alphaproteobacteria bacterium]|nr:TetR/AcrR family transcriptional regulator C-terminal domain-containing protein [Alphaproteobacteria bacterium]MCB9791100.1 TetR/AcrR family transcriptional regulator C-terminal domain-containing protein [Alphaproteobacteria bacterium]